MWNNIFSYVSQAFGQVYGHKDWSGFTTYDIYYVTSSNSFVCKNK